jgi:hypothetical protein
MVSVALYKQTTLKKRITAAGTVPDFHQIPFHHGGIRPPDCLIGCKGTNNRRKKQIYWKIFHTFAA